MNVNGVVYLPDGRALRLVTRSEIETTVDPLDLYSLQDEEMWMNAIYLLSDPLFLTSALEIRSAVRSFDLCETYHALKCYFSNDFPLSQSVFRSIETDYDTIEWWKAIPDSACTTQCRQEIGQAKVLDVCLRTLSLCPKTEKMDVVVVGSSSPDFAGVSVFSLAEALDVIAPSSTLTCYDPHEQQMDLRIGSTLVKRRRCFAPKDISADVVIDDSYDKALLATSWECPHSCKSLEGWTQPYYVGNERRSFAPQFVERGKNFSIGMDSCRDCDHVAKTLGLFPNVDATKLYSLYVQCGVRPCSSFPSAEELRNYGKVIGTVWAGCSFSFNGLSVDANLDHYERIATYLQNIGLCLRNGNTVYPVAPRSVPKVAPLSKCSVRSKVRKMTVNLPEWMKSLRFNWGQYATSVRMMSHPLSRSDVAFASSCYDRGRFPPLLFFAPGETLVGFDVVFTEIQVGVTTYSVRGRSGTPNTYRLPLSDLDLSQSLGRRSGLPIRVRMVTAQVAMRPRRRSHHEQVYRPKIKTPTMGD